MQLKHLLLATTFISASASAQITIQGSSLSGWAPDDTMKSFNSTVTAAATPNGNWDLTTATYFAGAYTTTDQAATHPSFPSAAFSKNVSYGLNAIGYVSTQYWGKDNSAVKYYGEQMDRQAYSIAAITMNTQDSLVFPEQTVEYATPQTTMAFPMSFGNNWNNSIDYTTDFELTVAMYGMNGTPGERRSNLVQRDTVKGWGKMRVNDVNGQASDYIDVLAVQEREYVTDSFYIGGSPAPVALLTAFGLSQGQVLSRFTTRFYRSGEVNPLLKLEHADSTFGTITGASAMLSRLKYPVTGVEGVSSNALNVYPNPVSDGVLHVTDITAQNNWAYTLNSVNGQAFAAGVFQKNNNTIDVRHVTPGVYTLTLLKDGVSQGGQFVIIR